MGTKIKVGKNQKTVLSDDELNKIVETFIDHKITDDFSVVVSYSDIKEKNYSLAAGQYFDIKVEFVELSQNEFDEMIEKHNNNLSILFARGKELESNIEDQLKALSLDDSQNK